MNKEIIKDCSTCALVAAVFVAAIVGISYLMPSPISKSPMKKQTQVTNNTARCFMMQDTDTGILLIEIDDKGTGWHLTNIVIICYKEPLLSKDSNGMWQISFTNK